MTEFGQLMPFTKGAHYLPPMDMVLFLTEDVSYRAFLLSRFVSVLMHPTEDRAVGLKIKGVRHLVESLRKIVVASGNPFTEEHVVSLIAMLEVAFASRFENILPVAEAGRREKLEQDARQLAAGVTIPSSELPFFAKAA